MEEQGKMNLPDEAQKENTENTSAQAAPQTMAMPGGYDIKENPEGTGSVFF